MKAKDVMNISPIVPIVTIDDSKDALDLAKALQEGGINIMEITLRTSAALDSIRIISEKMPSMNVGAGTVCNKDDLLKAKKSGAKFVFSPGISQELIDCAKKEEIVLIPGVSTSSEVMLAQNNGIKYCKLFPATLSGGIDILKAFKGPYSKISFCPTGGVNIENMNEFLKLENVPCVGGTWIVPRDVINNKDFKTISSLCIIALENIKG